MSHAQTDSEITPNHTFYVNMNFTALAADINAAKNNNDQGLIVRFNGKGQTVTAIPENLENDYFYYSSDSAGNDHITPPFEINNNDTVACMLQADPKNPSNAKGKWKNILQNRFDLQQVSKSNTQVIYKASATEGTSETDDVDIQISFKLDGEKYYASWDPQIIVKR